MDDVIKIIAPNACYALIIPLLAGYLLDLLLGDPRWLPHPIIWFGNLIAFFEKRFNKGNHRKVKGALVTAGLVFFIWVSLWLISALLTQFALAFYLFSGIMVFYGLANRTLVTEVLAVNQKLDTEGLDAGRRQLGFIVGRDTTNLTENQVRIASLETLSENLSDGVVAPLFYYALGGIPLMFAYKMVNTLDSMIGYKNEKYKDFGLVAARTDDVLNYIPARITALLMVMVSFSWRGFTYILKYGNKHSSPNSGYPEAALAGILGCRFGGPNVYHGVLVRKPYIGVTDRQINKPDITKACTINLAVSFICVALIVFLY